MIVRQGLLFLMVGAALVCVDWAVFVVFSAVGVPTVAANVAGRMVGAMLGFYLNGSLTFRSGQGARVGRRHLGRFAIAWLLLTALSTTLVASAAARIGLHYAWLAKPLVEALMALISFVISRQWVYQ